MEDWEKFEEKKPEDKTGQNGQQNNHQYGYYSTGDTSNYGQYGNYGNYEHNEPPKPKKKRTPRPLTMKTFVICMAICMVISAAMGACGYMLMMSKFGGTTIDKSVTTTNYNLARSTGSVLSVQEIIARNEESVVAISTEALATDFWMGQYVTEGAGSGVIISEDGYIVTNNHVIESASKIKVALNNGKEYDADLIATDEQTDVAVVKINASGLVPAVFGDMDSASVGDLVVAIGNPLGELAGTATEGIISCLARELTIDGKEMTLIQTSASVNPGNSGGGLFDQYGKLIGLVVAKSSGSDVEGLGFAIPCDKVNKVSQDLIESGHVQGRPAAGITIVDLTDASKAMQYGVSMTGVYIQSVNGENAKKAGLKPGDMIYYIDDTKVTGSSQLIAIIQNHEIGDKVTFTVVRDNEMIKFTVKLEDSANIKTSEPFENSEEGLSDAEELPKDKNQSQPGQGGWDSFYNDFFGGLFN